MFTGDYGFFEYKYNIQGYTGQDYGGLAQWLYLAISAVLLVLLLALLRKSSKRRVLAIIRAVGVFLTLFYIGKTIWESVYDIRVTGACNTWLMPFDTCSVIMPAALLAGFGKGKLKRMAECWLVTGGILGGFAVMLFMNALKWYPFLSFGALYTMLWHFLMVFLGLLILVTDYLDLRYSCVFLGYAFHLIASVPAIALNFLFDFDFMLYRYLGSVPFFEGLATRFREAGKEWINPLMMLGLYLLAFHLILLIPLVLKARRTRRRKKAAAGAQPKS
jgi:hypothetical protein